MYLIINQMVLGDFFAFLDIQKKNWGQSFGFFAENLKNIYLNLRTFDSPFSMGVSIPTIIIFFISIGLIIFGTRRIPIAYSLYSLVFLLISYSPTWLLSGPRYVFSIFPLFIILALIVDKKPQWEQALDYVLTALLMLYCILLLRGVVY